MAKLNSDILGTSKLKWMGMGTFNSDDHYDKYCGQESLEELEYSAQSTKESNIQYLAAISKMIEQYQFISKAHHSASW